MTSTSESAEIDAPDAMIDPFAGLFKLCRRMIHGVIMALLLLFLQGILLWHASYRASAHVYEIHPNGQASFIGDRESRILPRDYEARYVARHVVELLYGWNSASIDADLAEGLSLCTPSLATHLRQGFAQMQLVESARTRVGGIRSELEMQVKNLEHSRRMSRVHVSATLKRFSVQQYEGTPFDERALELEVILQVVRRSEHRPNGLEIVRLQELSPQPPQVEKE